MILAAAASSAVQAGAPRPGESAQPEGLYRPGRLMVQFSSGFNETVELQQEILAKSGGPVSIGLPYVDRLAAAHALQTIAKSMPHAKRRESARRLGIDSWFTLDFASDADMEALAAAFRALPEVKAASPDYYVYADAMPNDPYYSMNWGHENTAQLLDDCVGCGGHPFGSPVGLVGFDTNVNEAWNAPAGFGSPNVIIAVIDSGVELAHPELIPNLVPGWDYGDNDSYPDDDSQSINLGHGTNCAGIAAAVTNDGIGVSGVAGGCKIMPLKIDPQSGGATLGAIASSFIYAADNGAHIVSLSRSVAISVGSSPSTDAAIQYAADAGLVILCSASNQNADQIRYPANHAETIAVGAASPCGDRKRSSSDPAETIGAFEDPNGVTCDNEVTWGSNYGVDIQDAPDAIDVLAPIILPTTDLTTRWGGYIFWFSGTSCATPYAAGVCALMLSNDPGLTRTQIRDRLTSTARDVVNVESGVGWDRYSGYGLVDAKAALMLDYGPPEIAVTPASLSFTLLVGSTDSASLSISNVTATAAEDLNWSITDCPWATVTPSSGQTSRAETDGVSVLIESAGLLPGFHTCSLQITSDDPANPVVTVPIELNVVDQVTLFVSTAATGPVTVYTNPDGSGDALSAAQDWDGVLGSAPSLVDATISITVLRSGVPVVGLPAEQFRLVSSAGGWSICDGMNKADGPTNAAGKTTFSGPLFGGGHSGPGELMQLDLAGIAVGSVFYLSGGSGLDIRVNSADINRDMLANLVDVGNFAADLVGAYDHRSDFQWNGVQNLADVGVFASALGVECPGMAKAPAVEIADGSTGLFFDRGGRTVARALAPGEITTAYLLLRGSVAERGVTAWSGALDISQNVRVHEVVLPDGAVNLGGGEELVVGTGGVHQAKPGEALLLATLRVSVIDTSPARLGLKARMDAGAGLEISDGAAVLGTASEAAFINDEASGENVARLRGLELSNHPNPFNPATEIRFNLPREGRAEVRIYDVSGRLVSQLGGELLGAGAQSIMWKGTDRHGEPVVSGTYFYRLTLDGQALGAARKMSLLK